MSRTVAELLDDALTLPEPDRAELAELLAASLTSPTGSLHPDWAAELRRRAAEVDSGRVQPVAWEEVRQQVWAELNADEPMMKPESPTNEKARPSLRCRTSCCPRSADCWPLTRPDPPDGRTVLQAGFLTQQGYSSLDQIHARRALALVEWNIPSAIDHSEKPLMPTISVEEAQTNLPELIRQLAPGEAVTITENDRPVARIVPVTDLEAPRPVPGRCRGMMTVIAEDEEHLKDWAEYLP